MSAADVMEMERAMRQAAELGLSREVLGAIARQARDKARLSDDGLMVDTDGPGNTVSRGGGEVVG